MRKFRFIFAGMFIALIASLVVAPLAVSAKPLPPVPPVPPGGLTAKIIATPGQKITGNVDATGYDIGIYIGPHIKNVQVKHAKITGANQEGILVQDTSNIEITDSTISNNGIHSYFLDPSDPTKQVITEGKAIELVGTSNSIIKDNIVKDNLGDGGIGIADDGPYNPALPIYGVPNTSATVSIASTGNLITGNFVKNDAFGCGIVLSAYNTGAGVSHNIVSKNTVIGGWSGTPGSSIPYVGGIIVAADLPFTTAIDNTVLNNTVTGCVIMGVIVHSNAPGDLVSGTKVIGNTLSNDGNEGPPYDPTLPTGIAVVAEVPGGPNPSVLNKTQVLSNTVSNETYGVWIYNSPDTHIANLKTKSVTTPVSIKP